MKLEQLLEIILKYPLNPITEAKQSKNFQFYNTY